ncbi:hypothetical protein ASPBRDRAFT_262124 [Aspergillus brasiliensis CBS 101740]|uniref:Uncharacterized protein n=1 Tax=Aspergillus brasiliensis (strain CBS 101740 / IMI 381727 / IBT 21946) TaxID=767769 RepID=A0A1L9V2R6_ASPBC|nr:hypothetical protein ASPBRDRAFT_262124 [Aspergillus brasiliensis CBS 101740]
MKGEEECQKPDKLNQSHNPFSGEFFSKPEVAQGLIRKKFKQPAVEGWMCGWMRSWRMEREKIMKIRIRIIRIIIITTIIEEREEEREESDLQQRPGAGFPMGSFFAATKTEAENSYLLSALVYSPNTSSVKSVWSAACHDSLADGCVLGGRVFPPAWIVQIIIQVSINQDHVITSSVWDPYKIK